MTIPADVGSELAVVRALGPQTIADGSNVDGDVIDRQDFMGGVLYVDADQDVTATVQHSAEADGTFETYDGNKDDNEATVATADGEAASLAVDLRGAKRYIRVNVSNGSGLGATVAAALVLGGAVHKPATYMEP